MATPRCSCRPSVDISPITSPGRDYVEIPGHDSLLWAGDQAALVSEIESFVTGARSARTTDRRLATVLFTDIVGSTHVAADMGDRAWRELLGRHDALVRSAIEGAGGRVVKTTGDGVLATFDSPGRALEAARRDHARARRPSICTSERGFTPARSKSPPTTWSGSRSTWRLRVAALAGADEILVSSTVRDLVVGSGVAFVDRGSRVLKGVPGRWRIYAAGSPA